MSAETDALRERVTQLEERLARAEARIAALEARQPAILPPVFVPPVYVPAPACPLPQPIWMTITTGDGYGISDNTARSS